MIEHAHYRRSMLADPHSDDPALREHREQCAECNLYTEQLLGFEAKLKRALQVDIPSQGQVLPFARRGAKGAPAAGSRTGPRRWMALAASVVFGLVVGGAIWLSAPRPSLASEVVGHMADEPQAWQTTEVAVPDAKLASVLKDSKLRLGASAGTVSYASSCPFRGHRVPHLVVQTPSGPVTVMVLVHEPVKSAEPFEEQGYRGTIVPVAGHGSIAVLMRGAGAPRKDVDDIAARVRDAVIWTP